MKKDEDNWIRSGILQLLFAGRGTVPFHPQRSGMMIRNLGIDEEIKVRRN
jgi:hypothetical protein